jgi:hypothetical protein
MTPKAGDIIAQAPTSKTVARGRGGACRLGFSAALALFALAPIMRAWAQTVPENQPSVGTPFTAADAAEVKTLKEKLSDKASDGQRVDNCRVPPDRRGSMPRPDCPPDPTTASKTAGGAR